MSNVGHEVPLFVVTYPEALVERVVSQGQLAERTLKLTAQKNGVLPEGNRRPRAYIERTMLDFGFSRVDYVYEPGQFAIRGEIMDVFSFSSEYPYRIVFFDNEIESIRAFDVRTQLSVDMLEEVTIVPRLKAAAASSESIFSFLPKGTVVVAKDLRFVEERAAQVIGEGYDVEEGEREGLPALVSREEFKEGIEGLRFVSLGHSLPDTSTTISLDIAPQPLFHKNFELLGKTLSDYRAKGYRILILADSKKQQERLKSILETQDKRLTFTPVEGTLHAGFVDNAFGAKREGQTNGEAEPAGLCVFTDHQIFDRFHRFTLRSERARLGKVSLTLKELQEFRTGDYVVHVDHGIGRFGGLVRLPEGGKMVEKIKILYQRDDAVFVSIHALHKVSKYKGREGEQPRVSRLGTGAWERMKERAKTKIKDIARDLIRLYAQRQKEKGFRFSPDGYLQNELEASFPYEDTPDQALAYQSVKADMESERPMDRLVCGDVGFGKTEVAIRAAFKACVDGKQVAVLVPTTVLAFQHYRTFTERLKGFPVRVDYLSRAKTPQETREVLRALAEGSINIIVGTHKLIGKAVTFHDLGLLIIDEEQKFGVSTKEKLRQLRTNVDTLTLTATPIPRTLQFSLMGARDLSVIQTPPPNRQPIETQLCLFSPETIAEAVSFELARGGQVFIVNNRIAGLPALEEMVRRLVPYARIAVGHGQMPADELEQTVLRFSAYDYDVLISTTIIENGLDIPNANTIIVCDAQRFGLSDLHQMRGRVGRSSRKAFCYLLSPPLSSLTPEARRRLEAIESFSDLGSGINVAMQDLDIRGAGNMLGAEQSGFIADLGYETYQKILAEAVSELKGEEFADLYEGRQDGEAEFVSDCQIDSDIPMCFPEDYVPGSAERMLLYRELDAMRSEGEVEAFRKRMVDRFGAVPEEGEELMRVVELRRLGRRFGAQRIVLREGRMRLFFVQSPQSGFYRGKAFGQIIAFATANARLCRLEERELRRSLVIREVPTVERAVGVLRHIGTLRAV
ncbi:MAG: transcription-repair coupling factor [Prevotellaceae bacterium]|nr:transcription-repair coupling factor [Prevotellaceae bacterium]